MKNATFSSSAFVLTAILIATACSSNDSNSTGVGNVATEPTPDAGATATPTPAQPAQPEQPSQPSTPATPSEPDGEKKCAPTCKVDADCQSSCPAIPSGVQCCDLQSNSCFGAKGSVCPVTKPGGDPTPAY